MSWTRRFALLERHTQAFNPDWVSVQFVPYSFHRWGVAVRVCDALGRIARRARLHVMLHEIWTGGNGALRDRVLCRAQRWSVRHLCRQASLVHTSNGTYQHMLRTASIDAARLPLFGSIGVADTPERAWLFRACGDAGIPALGDERSRWWLLALFGTLHPSWPAEPLIGRLRAAAAEAGKQIALISVGRMGRGEHVWERMRAAYASTMPLVRLGEQPESRVAALLQEADFGIASSPYTLLGKSATAAAMFEHGLPVIVNRDDGPPTPADPIEPGDRELLIRLDDDFACTLRQARRRPARRRLTATAGQLLGDLSRVAVTA